MKNKSSIYHRTVNYAKRVLGAVLFSRNLKINMNYGQY